MRSILFLLFFFVGARICLGQNLVPNGSFEDVNICIERKAACSPSGWFYICKGNVTGFFSPGAAADEVRYLTIVTANRKDDSRSYWETTLLCPLVPGKKYTVSIRVAANVVGPNLHDIGFYFTDAMIFSWQDTLLQPAHYLSFLDARVQEMHNHWFRVDKEFTATEAHQYLIVGNFSDISNQKIIRQRNVKDQKMNMYIDDLEIIPEDKSICSGWGSVKDSLYAIHERHSTGGISLLPPLPVSVLSDDTARRTSIDTPALMSGLPPLAKRIDTLKINNIQFEFNSYTLKDPAASMDPLRKFFAKNDIKRVQVVGYTDNMGSDTYNMNLSEKRALEIRRLIGEKFRIKGSMIEATGKGISTSYSDKSQNRRVEVYIYH